MNCVRDGFLIVVLLLVGGCALQPPPSDNLNHCLHALNSLQHHIDSAAVNDAQYQPVTGFPTYRSNRFWSSFDNDALTPIQRQEWRQQLHQLGMSSLALEWRNLPLPHQRAWQDQWHIDSFSAFRQQCNATLWQDSLQRELTPAALDIADSYNRWQRILGLYAVTRYAARSSVADYQADMRSLMEQGATTLQPPFTFFAPKPGQDDTAFPLPPVSHSPLGLPQYSAQTLHHLFQWHAPRWQIETRTNADLIGTAQWHASLRAVDITTPQVYFYPSYIRHQDRILLQLNYVAWFSERPKPTAADWYGGKLDGLIWRVTLQPDGSVLFYDSIHPCGCYHTVHLPQGSPLSIHPHGEEPLLVFQSTLNARQHNPVLLVQSGTHYLTGIQAEPTVKSRQHFYSLAEYDRLRSLPADNHFRSWFDADGLIAESARRERFFLWPLGVPSAGAMRQQGHHAIAFLGRRHFDEATVESLLMLNPP